MTAAVTLYMHRVLIVPRNSVSVINNIDKIFWVDVKDFVRLNVVRMMTVLKTKIQHVKVRFNVQSHLRQAVFAARNSVFAMMTNFGRMQEEPSLKKRLNARPAILKTHVNSNVYIIFKIT